MITEIIYFLFFTKLIVKLKYIHNIIYIHVSYICERYQIDRATMNRNEKSPQYFDIDGSFCYINTCVCLSYDTDPYPIHLTRYNHLHIDH